MYIIESLAREHLYLDYYPEDPQNVPNSGEAEMTFCGKRTEVPNNSWLESSKSFFYFFCMVSLLKILTACLSTGIHILFSLLAYSSSIPRLNRNVFGKNGIEQFRNISEIE